MRVRLGWFVFVLVVGLAAAIATYGAVVGRAPVSVSTLSPTATPTSTPTATPSPSETPTPSPSPTPSPTPADDVTITVVKTDIPKEFRYLALGSGNFFRVLLLDMNERTATLVATARLYATSSRPGPAASLSSSSDGRIVLLTVPGPEQPPTLFLLRPATGEAQAILRRGVVAGAVVSPDGARFALGRADSDPGLAGLWVGTTADGTMRRLIADDPSVMVPVMPYAFSPDGTQLAFGVGSAESGRRAAIVSTSAQDLRIDRTSGATIPGGDVVMLGAATGAAFLNDHELFVWSSRSLFERVTATFTYDLGTKKTSPLYTAVASTFMYAAAWRPGAEQYATLEATAGGANAPATPWLRGRDGSARKTSDAGEFFGDLWWSRDGSRLFADSPADDATGVIVDLLTGKGVVVYCKRGGGPPPAPCA